MNPAWILADQGRVLSPPPEVLALGNARSAANYLAALRSLCVLTAARYVPDARGTWCNIFLADAAQILRAPIPHRYDLGDGQGLRELRANFIVDGMRDSKFPGWRPLQSASDAITRAGAGLPTIEVWKNPSGGPGHVVFVVPTPAGRAGVYVTGAGRDRLDQAPSVHAFGGLSTEFFTHD